MKQYIAQCELCSVRCPCILFGCAEKYTDQSTHCTLVTEVHPAKYVVIRNPGGTLIELPMFDFSGSSTVWIKVLRSILEGCCSTFCIFYISLFTISTFHIFKVQMLDIDWHVRIMY